MGKILAMVCLLWVGCASEKPPLDVDFSDLVGVDAKSDKFTAKMLVIDWRFPYAGTRSHKYSGEPRYRGLYFLCEHWEHLVFDVHSDDGDAVAWLVDEDMHVMKYNDDHEQTSHDARIRFYNNSGEDRSLLLVFSEYYQEPANFKIERWGTPP